MWAARWVSLTWWQLISSAEDLIFGTKSKTQPRVSVSIVDENNNNHLFGQQTTPIAKHGVVTNPEWNSAMAFTIDVCAALQGRLTLVAKLKTGGENVDDLIGEVRANIKELLEQNKRENVFNYVFSNPSGEAIGVLKFSCNFEEVMTTPSGHAAPATAAADGAVPSGTATAAAAAYPTYDMALAHPYGYGSWYPAYYAPPPVPYSPYPAAPQPLQPISEIVNRLATQFGLEFAIEHGFGFGFGTDFGDDDFMP